METVKSENFEQSSLTDESFSIFNIHAPLGFQGAVLVLAVLGLACLGYALARMKDRRKEVARRAATTLKILKSPAEDKQLGQRGSRDALLEIRGYQLTIYVTLFGQLLSLKTCKCVTTKSLPSVG